MHHKRNLETLKERDGDTSAKSKMLKRDLNSLDLFPSPPASPDTEDEPASSCEPAPAIEEAPNMDDKDPRVITVLTIVPDGMPVYKVHAAVEVTGNLTYFVEWDNEERDVNLVDAKVMKTRYPQDVIKFLERHLVLGTTNSSDSLTSRSNI